MCKEFHCEDGWLATNGTEDAVFVTHEMVIDAGSPELEGQVYLPLLIPQSDRDYTACPCSPLWSLNGDLSVRAADVAAIAPRCRMRMPIITNDSHFLEKF